MAIEVESDAQLVSHDFLSMLGLTVECRLQIAAVASSDGCVEVLKRYRRE